jgi:hypothetical protein
MTVYTGKKNKFEYFYSILNTLQAAGLPVLSSGSGWWTGFCTCVHQFLKCSNKVTVTLIEHSGLSHAWGRMESFKWCHISVSQRIWDLSYVSESPFQTDSVTDPKTWCCPSNYPALHSEKDKEHRGREVALLNTNYRIPKPITVASRSKAWTVFARSNIGIVGSNLT